MHVKLLLTGREQSGVTFSCLILYNETAMTMHVDVSGNLKAHLSYDHYLGICFID